MGLHRISYALIILLLWGASGFAQQNPNPDENPDNIPKLNIENAADVFLEAYSDEFQESFFEALTQKSIENYDRAINAFLKCKQLDSENPVVDYQLAQLYFDSRKYATAEPYAITAVEADPANIWYVDLLITIHIKQGKTLEAITTTLPFEKPDFTGALASLYMERGHYDMALQLTKKAQQNKVIAIMQTKIKDSLQKKEVIVPLPIESPRADEENRATKAPPTTSKTPKNPLEIIKADIDELMLVNDFKRLQTVSKEALESYPAQAYFYYTNGYALQEIGASKQAVEVLLTALDFLIDDVILEHKIYKKLAEAYTALDHLDKANMYLRKVN